MEKNNTDHQHFKSQFFLMLQLDAYNSKNNCEADSVLISIIYDFIAIRYYVELVR